ncbi:phage major capsid protein [Opitutus sp. ER46]|uniref:phage major capsid protein n=1 Tax=Opitutus sp. ER46 TaxID=2161864 RepID=UPI000D31D1FD|nr:phage major capsid protein [Opitutus sp. ER46]PTX96570.1 phage major capsid protein [Opitutus sp. ER46]
MSRFPSIYQIAVESRSAVGAKYLTREQAEAQEELRTRVPFGKTSGIILPWYEHRDLSATGTTAIAGDQGGMTISTEVPEIGAAFRDKLVLEKMGARVFGGLQSELHFPRALAAISADWMSENASGDGKTFNFGRLALVPHRITAWIDVSTQLLLQGSLVEPFLRSELMAALATEIQRVVISGTGSSSQPMGILNTPGVQTLVGGVNGAAPTYDNLCDFEYAVANGKADRGNLGWLVSPLTRKKLRKTEGFAGSGKPIWEPTAADSLLGYSAGVTTAVPDNLSKGSASGVCSAIAFLEMSEVIICLWGAGVEISATRAGLHNTGQTRVYASAYADGGLRIPGAAAVMVDALCA